MRSKATGDKMACHQFILILGMGLWWHVASADSIRFGPHAPPDLRSCFSEEFFPGYVTEYDGSKFTVVLALTGCGNSEAVPQACKANLAPLEALPPAFRAKVEATVKVLRAQIESGDLLALKFDDSFSKLCTEATPRYKFIPTPAVTASGGLFDFSGGDYLPTKSSAVFDKPKLDALGVDGKFVAVDWKDFSTADAEKLKLVLPRSKLNPASEELQRNDEVFFGGLYKKKNESSKYRIVEARIADVNDKQITMQVNDINDERISAVFGEKPYFARQEVKYKTQPAAAPPTIDPGKLESGITSRRSQGPFDWNAIMQGKNVAVNLIRITIENGRRNVLMESEKEVNFRYPISVEHK